MCLFFQREEIICCLAELLTEKKDEILSANRRDMELATASGTEAQIGRTDHLNPQLHAIDRLKCHSVPVVISHL